MLEDRRRTAGAIGAAQGWGYIFAFLRQALDVGFIDDGVFPGDVRSRLVAAPVEGFGDDDGLRHAPRIVTPIKREVLARTPGAIGEMRIAPYQPTGKPPGVGVEQQLVGIEAVAVLGLIGTVNAIALARSGRKAVQITMPYIFGTFGQFDALEFATTLTVEQANLDPLRVGGEQCKIGAPAVPACTEPRERSGG